MVARLLAFCLNAQEGLTFTKGLSEIDEPDIWIRTMDETTSLWSDGGEPDVERAKKAVRKAKRAKIYSFNTKSGTWWDQNRGKFGLHNLDVTRFSPSSVAALAEMVERTLDWSVTVTGQTAFVATPRGEVEVDWEELQSAG